MNVTVTREEIDQAKQLLDLLRQWEPIRKAGNHYDGGTMSVVMTGNAKGKVEQRIDRYDHERPGRTPVECCESEIASAARNAVEKLAADVCAIIEKHMPIPIGEKDAKK